MHWYVLFLHFLRDLFALLLDTDLLFYRMYVKTYWPLNMIDE